jgi:hypothetical protein
MGFRETLTTAEGVDTGESATGPGARIFQDTTSDFPRGVVEFRSGVTGDRHATLTRTVYVTLDANGNVIGRQGGTVQLDAGSVQGVEAGSLSFSTLTDNSPGAPAAKAVLSVGHFEVVASTAKIPGLPVPVANKAARDALTKYPGLTVHRLDMGGLPQWWDQSRNRWRYRLSGMFDGLTDANALMFWAHGSGGDAPLSWGCGPTYQGTDAANVVAKPITWYSDGLNLQARLVRTDSSTYLANHPLHVWWYAEF